jgi:hypothetical protein
MKRWLAVNLSILFFMSCVSAGLSEPSAKVSSPDNNTNHSIAEVSRIRNHTCRVNQTDVIAVNGIIVTAGVNIDGEEWVPLGNITGPLGWTIKTEPFLKSSKLIKIIQPEPVGIEAPTPPAAQVEVAPKISNDLTAKTSLAGVKSVSVAVSLMVNDDIKQQLSTGGVTENSIKANVELKLRTSGITVVDSGSVGAIRVLVMAVPTDGEFCYSIYIAFTEEMRPSNDLTSCGLATTWERVGLGTSSLAGIRANLSDEINTNLSSFCNDYLAENPITK